MDCIPSLSGCIMQFDNCSSKIWKKFRPNHKTKSTNGVTDERKLHSNWQLIGSFIIIILKSLSFLKKKLFTICFYLFFANLEQRNIARIYSDIYLNFLYNKSCTSILLGVRVVLSSSSAHFTQLKHTTVQFVYHAKINIFTYRDFDCIFTFVHKLCTQDFQSE